MYKDQGYSHSLALCSDGSVAAWGYNYYGQLGDNTANQRNVPVAVNTALGVSVLSGKTVVAISAGNFHSLAMCSDGTVAAWGDNAFGELGDNSTTQRPVPVAVNTTPLAAGERFTRVISGSGHTLALAAEPYASGIQITGNGVSIPDGAPTPGVGNLTDFGVTTVNSGTVVRTFTIQNTGNLPLNLTATPKVVVSGIHAADFTVTRQPDSPVAAGGSTTFEITFNPGTAWLHSATLTIANDAPYQNPYDFAVQGTVAGTLVASYATASDVPLSASGFTATGSTVNFTLNHAPATGTDLMVVRNTGIGFINGTFENLAQGQEVALLFGGITYDFVANYYGGSGNDLVLVWANRYAFGWGTNTYGQLGDNSTTQRQLPVPVTSSGVLAGKTVVDIAAGYSHSLALCSDGTVAAWGSNTFGQLGDNTTTNRPVPVVVNTASGVSALFGKTVVAIAAGTYHSLALCSDGSVVAWGSNINGALGDTTTTQRNVPVVVNTASGVSALFGKTVVAIAAGASHSLALCSDGTVAAWGSNSSGQLGNNTTTQSNVPVAVNTAAGSALFDRTVVAIAAGISYSLALCSDGTVAAWGVNANGQLGDNTTTNRPVPVVVNTTSGVSALFGKTVVAIAAGNSHSLAFCSDGSVAAWGYNYYGQLGDNTTTLRNVPVAVNTTLGVSALFGKTVVAIAAGGSCGLALCSDGTVAAWGININGQLGNNTTAPSNVPVAVNTTPLAAGERFTRVVGGSSHTLALAAKPYASGIQITGNGVSIPDGAPTPGVGNLTDFGVTTVNSGTVVRTFTIQNTGNLPLNLTATPKVAVSGIHAADFTVTRQPDSPVAAGGSTTFEITFNPGAAWLRTATLTIANDAPDQNPYDFAVQGTRAGTLVASYATASDVPLSASGFTATGSTVNFTLNHAPATGTDLMVVRNTGIGFINGTFENLAQGQEVALAIGGITYDFVANYYGGSGNDLVLVWANNRAFGWGTNTYGQLGDNSTTQRQLPVPVTSSGALAGKTVVAIAGGSNHSLASCSDGSVAAWGYNTSGQLGNNTTTQSNVPVAVNTALGVSALFDRTVVAIAAGSNHSLALCSDGSVVAWGSNTYGQLGDNTTVQRNVPVAVNTAAGSALIGKTVVAIAAGNNQSVAMCADGSVVAWGSNTSGQLGNNTTTQSKVPVAVNTALGVSALFGKTVVAIAAGSNHSLALCADGTVAAWGSNTSGQIGDNTVTQRLVPVAVNTASGVSALYGKTVIAIAAGESHSLALCSDGTMGAWGNNGSGRLGDNTTEQRNVPVEVNTTLGVSALFGRMVTTIAAGQLHSLALCADGSVAAWGSNTNGQLGDNTATQRNAPVAVNTTPLAAGERFTVVSSGSYAAHTLALVAQPPAPVIHITGNGVSIPDGATTPGLADHTDFGSTAISSGTVVRTFTIQNTGNLPLNLTGTPKVVVSGIHAADFTVTRQPVSPVAAGGSTTFQISFVPVAAWLRMATLTIASDDPYANPHDFAIQGNGAVTIAASYTTGSEVPLTTSGLRATGSTVNFTLNYAPATGKELMVVRNTGLGFINGTFSNLAQGQRVVLAFGGITYEFVANYYGGSGNDLILQWAKPSIAAWGQNSQGQLGNNSITQSNVPINVAMTGTLSAKTVVAIAAGEYHNLVLCSDGTVAAWGINGSGELGNNTTTQSNVPVAVNTGLGVSALFGKTVVAITAGRGHSLALCSDGSVVAWGQNASGQLGNNTTTGSHVPVAVNTTPNSALFGKTVVAIAAGDSFSLALCSDGTVVAWGVNTIGQLGNSTTTQSNVPVAVNRSAGSALFGKTVVAIAAGYWHSLALCSDGTVAAWGFNAFGELGDNTTTQRPVPVTVNTASGVSALFGKTVTAIVAGGSHSLARCSDGKVASWGFNTEGQLGNGSTTSQIPVPVEVTTNGILAGKTVSAIVAGIWSHNLALCSDGTLVSWGNNAYGELGNSSTTNSNVPVAVITSGVLAGKTPTKIAAGYYHSLALVAQPPAPAPDINITCNGLSIPDGGSQDFGNVPVGADTSLVFTVTNSGNAPLTGLAITKDGTDTAMFTVTRNPVAPVSGSGGSTTFTVRFAPTTTGILTAALHIGNNDPDENPFDIMLTGSGGTPLQIWRQIHFANIDNSGNGADLNDFDKDGIPNLVEFAFGLNPGTNSAGLLPAPQKNGNNFVVSFTQDAGVSGITYGAEWSQTLLAGSWTAVPDTGNTGASPPQHTFSVPIGTKTKLYMRLKVTSP